MLTKAVIESLYKKFDKRCPSPDELEIAILFEHLSGAHEVMIDEHASLIINSLPLSSPFHSLPLRNIHAIVNFEDEVAIVLHSSIIILDKHTPNVFINLKATGQTFSDRIISLFHHSPANE